VTVAHVVELAENKLELIENALAQLAAITAVYRSPDGLVVAEADASGALVGLWLDESLCQHTGADVGQRIVEAAAQAAGTAATRRDYVFSALTSGIATSPSRSLL
jgi:DNA-binding protein YbaB